MHFLLELWFTKILEHYYYHLHYERYFILIKTFCILSNHVVWQALFERAYAIELFLSASDRPISIRSTRTMEVFFWTSSNPIIKYFQKLVVSYTRLDKVGDSLNLLGRRRFGNNTVLISPQALLLNVYYSSVGRHFMPVTILDICGGGEEPVVNWRTPSLVLNPTIFLLHNRHRSPFHRIERPEELPEYCVSSATHRTVP